MANTAISGSVLTTPKDASVTAAKLNDNAISGQTELTGRPAETDEILLSDGGSLKRQDVADFKLQPSFSAYSNTNQTGIADGTWTKVAINTEEWDTEGWFDAATNYRFTPLIAGKYWVYGQISMTDIDDGELVWTAIYKNGTKLKDRFSYAPATRQFTIDVGSLIDLNGSTDYVELFGQHGNTGTNQVFVAGANNTYFIAVRVSP